MYLTKDSILALCLTCEQTGHKVTGMAGPDSINARPCALLLYEMQGPVHYYCMSALCTRQDETSTGQTRPGRLNKMRHCDTRIVPICHST